MDDRQRPEPAIERDEVLLIMGVLADIRDDTRFMRRFFEAAGGHDEEEIEGMD